jgi:monoamine oxidase
MQLASEPRLTDAPSEAEVAIVGAGAAGIAAARRCLAAGLTVAVLEARRRVGGRAVTAALRGHPVDLGPHWLHSGPVNPLVALAAQRGETLRRAPLERHLFIAGRRGSRAEREARGRAFDRADRALTHHAKDAEDRPAATALPFLGPWREPIATVHGLVSGRPLAQVSLQDFPSTEYADNRFIAGGLGAYVARLAAGLPIRLNAAVERIDWSGAMVRLGGAFGAVRARAVIVTIPPAVLQRGALRFTPDLPAAISDAIHGFLAATYEHVVLHWPGAPFRGADRLASLVGSRHRPPGLLTRIDGTPFHYFELDHPTATALRSPDRATRFARRVLAEHFGARAIADLSIPVVTEWRNDPFALSSWSAVPPGRFAIRDTIKAPAGEKLWFTGEYASRAQWGTVGGAWQEGERAADAAVAALRGTRWQGAAS